MCRSAEKRCRIAGGRNPKCSMLAFMCQHICQCVVEKTLAGMPSEPALFRQAGVACRQPDPHLLSCPVQCLPPTTPFAHECVFKV
eukprot:1233830-Amphidinium_carterae.1